MNDEDSKHEAREWKVRENSFCKKKKYWKALNSYNNTLEIDPKSHILC